MKTIAVFPDQSYVADEISFQLRDRGYTALLQWEVHHLLIERRPDEAALSDPRQLSRFREGGIDAIITVSVSKEKKKTWPSLFGRFVSTHNGNILGEVLWRDPDDDPADTLHDLDQQLCACSRDILEALLACAGLPERR